MGQTVKKYNFVRWKIVNIMNICIINHRENNPYIGGVERASYTLGEQWFLDGHHVIFLSVRKSSIQQRYTTNCKEVFLPNPDDLLASENISFTIDLFKRNRIDVFINQCSVFPEICLFCKKIKLVYNGILITTIHYAPLCELAGIKNNFFIKERMTGLKSWIIDCLLFLKYYIYKRRLLILKESMHLKEIALYSDAIVCLSKHFVKQYKVLMGSLVKNRLFVIPNPYVSNANKKNYEKKKQVLYCGRLEFGLKRVDRLIRIWEKTENLFPEWSLYIVGDGYIRSMLENIVHKKHLKRVHFERFQCPDKYYEESSILCLTSSSEGFGLVLIEALDKQCIPIAYNSFDSLQDIIKDGINGCMVSAFNEEEYVKRLHTLMENPALLQKMRNNSHITLSQFDVKTISDKWINLFESLIN